MNTSAFGVSDEVSKKRRHEHKVPRLELKNAKKLARVATRNDVRLAMAVPRTELKNAKRLSRVAARNDRRLANTKADLAYAAHRREAKADKVAKSAFGVEHEIAKLGLGSIKTVASDIGAGLSRGASAGLTPGAGRAVKNVSGVNRAAFKTARFTTRNAKPLGIGAGIAGGTASTIAIANKANQ